MRTTFDTAPLCENPVKSMMCVRSLFTLLIALLGVAATEPSHALALGRLRGAAILGQELNVSVALQLGAGDGAGSMCAQSQVFYGEISLDPAQVVSKIELVDATSAKVHIRVHRLIDEPIVTLYLRVGCGQYSTRKYVLLSEYQSEVDTEVVMAPSYRSAKEFKNPSKEVVSSPPLRSESPSLTSPKNERGNRRAAPKAIRGVIAESIQASEQEGPPAKKSKEKLPSHALLRLTVPDNIEWEPRLKFSDELVSVSDATNDAQRMQLLDLWRTLNASPEEVLRDAAKRAALESEIEALKVTSRANQQALADLSQTLAQVQDGKYANPLVYALVALLLVSGVGFGFVLRQKHGDDARSSQWWLRDQSASARDAAQSFFHKNASQAKSTAPGPDKAVSNEENNAVDEITPLDVGAATAVSVNESRQEVGIESASAKAAIPPVRLSDFGQSDFSHSVMGALRAINTKEMVDVRQQADFFLALGQYDEAIALLKEGIKQRADINPYIYLDLIDLLFKLSRKDEFEQVRSTFNTLFSGWIPEYGYYSSVTKELIDYTDTCDVLVSLWPSRYATEYIEHCLIREESDANDCGFELEAFKDLLLLHGILGKVPLQDAVPSGNPPVRRLLPLLTTVNRSTSVISGIDGVRKNALAAVDLDLPLEH